MLVFNSYHFISKHTHLWRTLITAFLFSRDGVDAISALVTGKFYDKVGLKVLLPYRCSRPPVALLGFSSNFTAIICGVVCGEL